MTVMKRLHTETYECPIHQKPVTGRSYEQHRARGDDGDPFEAWLLGCGCTLASVDGWSPGEPDSNGHRPFTSTIDTIEWTVNDRDPHNPKVSCPLCVTDYGHEAAMTMIASVRTLSTDRRVWGWSINCGHAVLWRNRNYSTGFVQVGQGEFHVTPPVITNGDCRAVWASHACDLPDGHVTAHQCMFVGYHGTSTPLVCCTVGLDGYMPNGEPVNVVYMNPPLTAVS